MKHTVLLINPPQTYYTGSQSFNVYVPIGLLNIAAVIEHDCHVSVYDCLVSDTKKRNKNHSIIYGATDKEIRATLQKIKPTIVGISIPFSSQRNNGIRVAKLVKAYSKKILVIVGGPDASVAGHAILQSTPYIDVCVQGEGEYVFLQIIQYYKNHRLYAPDTIPGIYYRQQKTICFSRPSQPITNLDALPFPKYDLISFERYMTHPLLYKNRSSIANNSVSIITSRGCPYNCIFCSVFLHMGKLYRTYSAAYVMRHIHMLVKKYRIQNIHFEDDNLTLNKSRFEAILDGLIKIKSTVHWDTPNGVRADTLTFSLLQKMQRAGCASLVIGIESASQRVLDTIIEKHLDLRQVERVAGWCKKLHIPLGAFFVIGLPGEKQKEIKTTLDYAAYLFGAYKVTPNVFVATPLYGTRLYDVALKNHFITNPITEKQLATGTQLHGNHLLSTKDFSQADIDFLVKAYEAKIQLMEWGTYQNSYNWIVRILKKIIIRYVYPSNNILLWRVAYSVKYSDEALTTLIRRIIDSV